MNSDRLIIPSDGCTLEAVMHPGKDVEKGVCVLTHPHPQYGGNMSNNVVMALALALPATGISAMRFNFRGVGNSTGDFDNGIGEAEDIKAVVKYLADEHNGLVYVAGYSFGAYVACRAINSGMAVDALCLISLPLDFPGLSARPPAGISLMAVVGDRDAFCSVNSFKNHFPDSGNTQIIKGADHFWGGMVRPLAIAVVEFFENQP